MTVKRWMVQDSVGSGAALASLEGEETGRLWLAAQPEHGFQTLQGLAYALAREVRRLQPDSLIGWREKAFWARWLMKWACSCEAWGRL